MNRYVFDASFKRMAIDFSYARGSVKEVADELGTDAGPTERMVATGKLTRANHGLPPHLCCGGKLSEQGLLPPTDRPRNGYLA
jgi:hypothetical protein